VEISDYLRALGKRLWLLILIPLLAGAVAFAIAYKQPEQYQTKATVSLPNVGASNQPSEVAQAVADFQAAAASPPVLRAAAKDASVPYNKVKSNVSTARVNLSSQVAVLYTSPKRNEVKTATDIVTAVTNEALNFMFQSRVSTAQERYDAATKNLDAAKANYDAALKAQNDFLAANNFLSPDDAAKTLQTEISDLSVKLADAKATGATSAANTYQAEINARQQALTAIGPKQVQYSNLSTAVDDQKQVYDDAVAAQRDAQQTLNAAQPNAQQTFAGIAVPQSKSSVVLKTTAVAVIAAIPLAVGLIVLLELASRRRARRRAEAAAKSAAPGTLTDPPPMGSAPASV
jgi:uncharacterized protein involved in exopolysaccharide biosynthesis